MITSRCIAMSSALSLQERPGTIPTNAQPNASNGCRTAGFDAGEMMQLNKKLNLGSVALMISLMCGAVAAQNRTSGPVEFSLRSIDGQTVTSGSLRGEVVVLAVGASWLPLSRAQLQGVKKLADEYSGRGVVVYWISTESEDQKSKNYASDEQLRAFAQKYGLKVTVLRDPDGAISKRMGVEQLPSMLIIDKQGNIVGEPIGGLDPNGNIAGQLASRLDRIL
jgi:peroxiredoxin